MNVFQDFSFGRSAMVLVSWFYPPFIADLRKKKKKSLRMHQKILMWLFKKLSISQIQSTQRQGKKKSEIVESWASLFISKAFLSPW